MIDISTIFKEINQGKKARVRIEKDEDINNKIIEILKGKRIRYHFHLTKGIIHATINRCLDSYGESVDDIKFNAKLQKSIEEQYWIFFLKHYTEVKLNNEYNIFKEKYLQLCNTHINLRVSGLSDSNRKEITDSTWNEFEDRLFREKHFEITTSLESYLKKIAENKAINPSTRSVKKGKKKPGNLQNLDIDSIDDNGEAEYTSFYNDNSISVNNDSKNSSKDVIALYDKIRKFDTIDKFALKTFCRLQESNCKKFLRHYYSPVLMYNMSKFTKEELGKLASNELEEIEKIQDQQITKKLTQKAALEQTGIPHDDHPEREHKKCLEEWQQPLLKRLNIYYAGELAKLIDDFKKRHLKKKKIKPEIHEN